MRAAGLGLAFGVAFGALLAWGGLSDARVIEDMLMLRSLDVFFLMGSAMAVAAIGAHGLKRARARALVDGSAITWSAKRPTAAHVGGAALFGVGWAVSLTCPGPLAAQLGGGNTAAIATAVGVVSGVVLVERWTARASLPPKEPAGVGL